MKLTGAAILVLRGMKVLQAAPQLILIVRAGRGKSMGDESNNVTSVREVTCPRCGQRTDRIQSFEVQVTLFLFLYIAWNAERVAGCPGCVRARLWQLFWISLPAANVLFPIIGPLIYWDIVTSRRTDRPGIPLEYAEWERLPPFQPAKPESDHGKLLRMVIALVILAIVVVVMFVVLPRLTR